STPNGFLAPNDLSDVAAGNTVFVQGAASAPPGTFVAVGDFNGDAIPDLVGFDNGITVAFGTGTGAFKGVHQQPTTIQRGSAAAVGDYNGDGKLDVAAILPDASQVAVFVGHGDGSFQNPLLLDSGGFDPAAIAVGDFNGDGHMDIAVAN